ncbi:MAG: CPBP family intramembrane metalloprotease [Deinococcota bacterium]|jgi:membrane protease YdiL (CAAX protease family)|nr:CPBP family intramembrane metalloprotease [Deinococcota bacterium]
MRRYLVFLPSLLTGLAGGVWLLLRPLELGAQAGPLIILLTAALTTLGLLGGAWGLERLLPSFRTASKLLENALRRFPITLPLAFGLAAATAVSEELFFRGALLPLLGVWGQAAVFALLHPAPRRAWSYTAYTFVAGLVFGYVTLWTGSLWAAMLAHFAVNFYGFLEVRRLQRGARRRPQPQVGVHLPNEG